MPHIYIDADGCPVKDEVYRVAQRYDLHVTLAANTTIRTPDTDRVKMVVVDDGFDAADDWIVEHAQRDDIVITTDIPLAARCLENGARALNPKGRIFTPESIGDALATREFMSQMREHNIMSGGPAPFSQRDRSLFLQHLDKLIHASQKSKRNRLS